MLKIETYRGINFITLANGKQLQFADADYELVESHNLDSISFKLKNNTEGWKRGDIIEIDKNGKIRKI